MRNFILPAAIAVILLVLHDIPYGKLTFHKRGTSPEIEAFAQRLKDVPASFGDWDSEAEKLDDRQLAAANAMGSYSRVFHNRFDPQKVVQVFILCGHPQDVTLHSPDRCYRASGFKEDDEERKFPIDYGKSYGDKTAYFTTDRFKMGSEMEGSQILRIFWSFSDDGNWQAPTSPKWTFATSPAMYKIYAISMVHGEGREQPSDSPCNEFLRQFLPVMNAALFPETGGSNAAAPTAQEAGKADTAAHGAAADEIPAAANTPAAASTETPPEKPSEPAAK